MVLRKKIVVFALLICGVTATYASATSFWSCWCCSGDNDVEAFSNKTTASPSGSPVRDEAPVFTGLGRLVVSAAPADHSLGADDATRSTSSQAESPLREILSDRVVWLVEAVRQEGAAPPAQPVIPVAAAALVGVDVREHSGRPEVNPLQGPKRPAAKACAYPSVVDISRRVGRGGQRRRGCTIGTVPTVNVARAGSLWPDGL